MLFLLHSEGRCPDSAAWTPKTSKEPSTIRCSKFKPIFHKCCFCSWRNTITKTFGARFLPISLSNIFHPQTVQEILKTRRANSALACFAWTASLSLGIPDDSCFAMPSVFIRWTLYHFGSLEGGRQFTWNFSSSAEIWSARTSGGYHPSCLVSAESTVMYLQPFSWIGISGLKHRMKFLQLNKL